MRGAAGGIWKLAAVALLIGGCTAGTQQAAQTVPAGPQTIDSEAAFRAQLAGRDLLGMPDEVLRASHDGSWLLRRDNHIAASGIWAWEGPYWCRTGQAAGQPLVRRCDALMRDGAVLRMTGAAGGEAAAPTETWRILD